MKDDSYPFALKAGNYIYNKAYLIYQPLYFLYKKITDKKEIVFLNGAIKEGMRVLDIGGNIGFYALLFSKLVGEKGSVHVFEPEAINFDHLRSNTEKLHNVIANNSAVGETTGKIRLYYSGELNVDHQTYDNGENRPYQEVDCLSIDDYFKKEEAIDFIKIDIQGYDYYALKGMARTIKRSKNVRILGEFWPYGLKRASVDPLEYLGLLRELGFHIKVHGALDERDCAKKVDDKLFYTNYYGEKNSK